MVKGQGHWKRNVEIVFGTYIRQSGSIYVIRRPNWSSAHSTHTLSNTFHQRKWFVFC